MKIAMSHTPARWVLRILLHTLAVLGTTLWFTGCASPHGHVDSEVRHLEFVLETEPSGVEVHVPNETDQTRVRLGATPLSFSLPLEPAPLSPHLWERLQEGLQPPAWRPQTPTDPPLSVDVVGDELHVQISKLEFHHPEYETQTFSHRWRIPADLKRNQRPVEEQKRVSMHMKQPLRPQHLIDVIMNSPAPDTRLHALAEDGAVGPLVGVLPITFQIGFAPLRSDEGEILQWLRWNTPEETTLWEHTDEGDLLFTGVLVREGYEPLAVQQRPIARASSEQDSTQTVRVPLQPLRPEQPEASFTLKVDSLPSGAEVYPLRDEGALDAKLTETPFTVTLGLGQVLAEAEPGAFIHDDWLIWSDVDIVRWTALQDGSVVFYLYCALHHDDYALEHVAIPIFTLEPGQPFPTEETINIPLLTPEQAAARAAREIRQPPPSEDSESLERPGVVWQAPDPSPDDRDQNVGEQPK